jgi:hypothetical protein
MADLFDSVNVPTGAVDFNDQLTDLQRRYPGLSFRPSAIPAGEYCPVLGATDRGTPEAWETQEQYHRRTGKGFFLGGPSQAYRPADDAERQPLEDDRAYARRLRAIADRLDPQTR